MCRRDARGRPRWRAACQQRGERIERGQGVGSGRAQLDLVAVLHAERHERHGAARIGFASAQRQPRVDRETAQRGGRERRGPGVDAVLEGDAYAAHRKRRRTGRGRRGSRPRLGGEFHERVARSERAA